MTRGEDKCRYIACIPGQPYGVAWPMVCTTDLQVRQAAVIAEKIARGDLVLVLQPEVPKA